MLLAECTALENQDKYKYVNLRSFHFKLYSRLLNFRIQVHDSLFLILGYRKCVQHFINARLHI